MTSFIVACIAITIVILIGAFIIGAIGGIITGTIRSAKKSPLKSIIALMLIGWTISSASKYKKVEQPQQIINPAQTQIQPQQAVICTQTQKVNVPPTNTVNRRIGIYVYGDSNMTEIEDVIFREMDTRSNAPLIEKEINSTEGTITAHIKWKASMPNPPEIKSTVDEIIDMSQNVDSEQKERIGKLIARMQKPVYTRIDHDTLDKPHPISVESNQQCVNKS